MTSDEHGQSRDRLRQLRAFCHAAQLQSMSKAADRLSLSQPAVSRQIRALEEEFSTVLFERHGPRIALTPAGRSLQRIALPLVRSMDGLPVAFTDEVNDTVSGNVHIAAGMTGSLFILPDHVRRFRSLYPDVQIRVTTIGAKRTLKLVRAHEADLAVVALDFVPKDLDFRPFLSSNHVLIVPFGHPLEGRERVLAEEIASHPAILPSGGYGRTMAEVIARYLDVEWTVAVEATGWNTIKRYVEAGLGLAVVPDLCLTESDRVSVVGFDERISHFIRPRIYGVVLRRSAFLPRAARRFVQMMDPGFPDRHAAETEETEEAE